jgi:hypothetical protein
LSCLCFFGCRLLKVVVKNMQAKDTSAKILGFTNPLRTLYES